MEGYTPKVGDSVVIQRSYERSEVKISAITTDGKWFKISGCSPFNSFFLSWLSGEWLSVDRIFAVVAK